MTHVPADVEGFAAFLLRMRGRGIANKELFDAIEATSRRAFVPAQWQDVVWSEGMIPIECGEALEGTDVQAQALAALDVHPGQRVLEVGTGSGYTAALMGRLGGKVLSLERYKTLVNLSKQRLEAMSLNTVTVRHADGAKGMASEGPFDRIVVWAAFDSHPRLFVEMLSTGGIMVAPIGPPEGKQALVRLTKVGSRFDREDVAEVRLQPLTPGIATAL